MIEYLPLVEFFGTIAVLIGFTEWRYRALHSCLDRIEKRIDIHLENRSSD